MNYRYKKGQIFAKKLKVPKPILDAVYGCTLSFDDFIRYELDDKIPTSCLIKEDRLLVEKFGLEKTKTIDWELIEIIKSKEEYHTAITTSSEIKKVLLELDPNVQDINQAIHEKMQYEITPATYSKKMKKRYKDRLFDLDSKDLPTKAEQFNAGALSLTAIMDEWEYYKDKDLSYCLKNDHNNRFNIDDSTLKELMNKYGPLLNLYRNKNSDIYITLNELQSKNPEEQKNYIIELSKELLKDANKNDGKVNRYELEKEDYKEIFKYYSFEEALLKINKTHGEHVIKELESLPEDYIYNSPIPASLLFNPYVLQFVATYGLKNVVDFDNECGHFFSKNNCEMLKLMFDMYLHYASTIHEGEKTYYPKGFDEDYTKDEFYEVMRRMIVYGPTDFNYMNKAPDYRTMTGEFRTRNKTLFLDEDAPDDLKKLFYTKSITPEILAQHKDYIKYLKGKNLSSCFKNREIEVEGSTASFGYENLYEYISHKTDFDNAMKFIMEYSEVLDIIYSRSLNSINKIKLTIYDSFEDIERKINAVLKDIIVREGISYPAIIPDHFIKQYPNLFLSEDAPQELKEAFYSRKLTREFILSDPRYIEHLKKIDGEVLLKYMNLQRRIGNNPECITVFKILSQTFSGEELIEIIIQYGKYLEEIYDCDVLKDLIYKPDYTKEELLDELDRVIFKAIIEGKIKYDESMPEHFKDNHKTLFLDEKIDPEIRKKFYNREFTLNDFDENLELLDSIGKTNVALGFGLEYAWISTLFSESKKYKVANYNRLKVISAYEKIDDINLRKTFKQYILEHVEELNIEKISFLSDLLARVNYSNSAEIQLFKTQLFQQLLNTDDPVKNLEKIETIFLKNNLPLCGKMYLCFKILYPDLEKVAHYDFSSRSRIAPQLKDETLPNIGFHTTSNQKRLMIIYNDLLRLSYKSNERSFVEYLDNIEKGNDLYIAISNNNFDISNLTKEEKDILEIFVSHLEVLYQNTKYFEQNMIDVEQLSLEEKLKLFGELFGTNERYELKDRIIRSFCFFAGIESYDELKNLMKEAKEEQEERTDKFLRDIEEKGKFVFEEGDFVRGIGNLDCMGSTLNAGNVSKEHLGAFTGTSTHDTTPLDVDLTLVTKTNSIYNAIDNTPTGFGFGNIYIIMKKDNPNLNITRDKDGNLTGATYDPKKVEVFGTCIPGTGGYETHWGARTGVAFTDIDAILYKANKVIDPRKPYDENGNVNYEPTEKEVFNDLPALKMEIARNGYYIPVIDFAGKLIFTKEEYKQLRRRMSGLSYYGCKEYKLASDLKNSETEKIASELNEESVIETSIKREKIIAIVKNVLNEFNLGIKYKSDGDLTPGSVEFIDTGSTGRNTNVPHSGDFDFFMRLDNEIFLNDKLYRSFKDRLMQELDKYEMEESIKITDSGDIRCKGVKIDEKTTVDIDISFGVKTNKVTYSSDKCLQDRLENIKEQYPDDYKYVVANIIQAKQVLKDAEAYKPRKSDPNQGGIGGVGIENWVLQNGGSFLNAAKHFLNAALLENGEICDYEVFKERYQIWDFGENYFSARKGYYKHDNFVVDNMTPSGYKRMAEALKTFVLEQEMKDTDNMKR